jgi:hypothetical protein
MKLISYSINLKDKMYHDPVQNPRHCQVESYYWDCFRIIIRPEHSHHRYCILAVKSAQNVTMLHLIFKGMNM